MRIFETTSMFDFENQEWVEIYHIDGEEVDAETYFEEMEYEVDGDDNEDEKPTIDEIINEYVCLLYEVAPCPDCMKKALEMFYDEVTKLLED